MKKSIIIISLVLILTIGVSFGTFWYYHPTHYAFNDRFVIGHTPAEITEKYGAFTTQTQRTDGSLACGTYQIQADTKNWIMGKDDSLWYEITFENGIAVGVNLREGYIGG